METLRPTYRLLIGIPGKSNAFAISSKLGLPDEIIASAKEHISEEDESFEDLLSDLETSRRTIENEQNEIQRYKAEVESLKKNWNRSRNGSRHRKTRYCARQTRKHAKYCRRQRMSLTRPSAISRKSISTTPPSRI